MAFLNILRVTTKVRRGHSLGELIEHLCNGVRRDWGKGYKLSRGRFVMIALHPPDPQNGVRSTRRKTKKHGSR